MHSKTKHNYIKTFFGGMCTIAIYIYFYIKQCNYSFICKNGLMGSKAEGDVCFTAQH